MSLQFPVPVSSAYVHTSILPRSQMAFNNFLLPVQVLIFMTDISRQAALPLPAQTASQCLLYQSDHLLSMYGQRSTQVMVNIKKEYSKHHSFGWNSKNIHNDYSPRNRNRWNSDTERQQKWSRWPVLLQFEPLLGRTCWGTRNLPCLLTCLAVNPKATSSWGWQN